MRVPLEWLADYVALEIPAEELAHRLTMTGLKVESVEQIGAGWHGVVVGEVLEIAPHPTSRNPLHVAQVNVGNETVTLVTGAQNVSQGDKVPVFLPGSIVPNGPNGEPFEIAARPMAGITSNGMMGSAAELGIADEAAGIYILPPDAVPGTPLSSLLGGVVLEIETNPNRPDTLSMIGIAREVAAITEQQLTLPDTAAITGPVEWTDEASIPVRIEAPDLCPRYSALRIENVPQGPSPAWMAQRLERAGMRPINLLVDITNYVMLELGQPMHAFDAARLSGGEIVVRRAQPGETIRTLDGMERVLGPENLVIADGARAVAVAGVMGGEESEITPETQTIILESATFNPVSVRRTAQSLGLRTEASSRFEKGLPPEQTVPALLRYLQLLAQLTDRPLRVAQVSDVWLEVPAPRTVEMPVRDLDRLLGVPISALQAEEALSLLGFDVIQQGDTVQALVPYWRRADVFESADLVEEVARIVGFDTIPATLPRHTMEPAVLPPDLFWTRRLRERLRAAGLSEAITESLTSDVEMARFVRPRQPVNWPDIVAHPEGVYAHEALIEPLHLLNPATQDRNELRLTALPGLIGAVARNLRHTDERLAFFELGRTFFPRPQGLPYERQSLAMVLSGRRRPRTWDASAPGPHTFYDIKGLVEVVLELMQISGWRVVPAEHPSLHPGRSAALWLRGEQVAFFGELHLRVAEHFEIENWPVYVAEIDLDALIPYASAVHTFTPLPRYPAARRDIAVVVDSSLPADEILRVVWEHGAQILERAEIFDVYQGAPLPAGRKSIAVALDFRAPGATLTQDVVNEVLEDMIAALQRDLGAELRD